MCKYTKIILNFVDYGEKAYMDLVGGTACDDRL